MTKIWLLFLAISLCSSVSGQTNKNQERLRQIRDYMVDSSLHVPHFILDSIIENFQKGLSGSNVKDGKLSASSLTITDKGASLQVSLKKVALKNKNVYIAANLTGTGNEKFISVAKDGDYKNSISTGLVFNIFPASGSGFFKHSERWLNRTITEQNLDNYDNLKYYEKDPFDAGKDIMFINGALDTLRLYEQMLKNKFGDNDNTSIQYQKSDLLVDVKPDADLIHRARVCRDTLIALGILPQKYLNIENVSKRIAIIPANFANDDNTFRLKKFLTKAEKELMNASWTAYSLHWFTIKPNFNVSPYKMINPEKQEDNYADIYNDNYFSLALSYNYTHRRSRGKQFQWSGSPTLTLLNARDFTALTEQTITKTESIQINGETISKTVFSTTGYTEKPDRKWGWNLELPLTLFWNKHNFGLDIAIRGGENNPYGDNLGGRFGVYIPIEIKEGLPVWIEPIIKVGKLGNSKNTPKGKVPLEFWQDNVEFGFNLSVAVPNFKAFKK